MFFGFSISALFFLALANYSAICLTQSIFPWQGGIMIKGCFTALVTPYSKGNVDGDGLRELCDFQIENGISGILAVGTTGESPTLSWDEHNKVIENVSRKSKDKCLCIAGTGSNNTKEAL